jgi:SAM-dependent methyltransferase
MADQYEVHRMVAPGYLLQVHAILRLIQEPVGRALDLGCGTGDLLEPLPLSCTRRIGVDISGTMLRTGRRLTATGTQFVQANACRIPLADGSFDSIVSVGMVEYVWPDTALLSEVRRLLRPGGQVVLCFPHGKCLARQTGLALKRLVDSVRGGAKARSLDDVIQRPTPGEFDAAMSAHGMGKEASHFLFPQFIDWPLTRWLRSTDNRVGTFLDPVVGRVPSIGRIYVGRWRVHDSSQLA